MRARRSADNLSSCTTCFPRLRLLQGSHDQLSTSDQEPPPSWLLARTSSFRLRQGYSRRSASQVGPPYITHPQPPTYSRDATWSPSPCRAVPIGTPGVSESGRPCLLTPRATQWLPSRPHELHSTPKRPVSTPLTPPTPEGTQVCNAEDLCQPHRPGAGARSGFAVAPNYSETCPSSSRRQLLGSTTDQAQEHRVRDGPRAVDGHWV